MQTFHLAASDTPTADSVEQLELLKARTLHRALTSTVPLDATHVQVGSETLLDFASNDYLNLAGHPRVVAAAADAASRYGAGARASRALVGNLPVHEQLEAEIASFKRTEAALVFSSGYLANLGVLQALSYRADGSRVPVYFDKLSHACIVDGSLASGPRNWRTFPHNDAASLERLVSRAPTGKSPRALVVTEGVFSMDGDIALLPKLFEICERHDALLIVDDAHGTGTIGEGGRGAMSHHDLPISKRVLQVGTLSKSLGSQGGFVAAAKPFIDLLVNRARAFLFETGLAPACAAAALESLRVLQEEAHRVDALQANSSSLRKLLRQGPGCTPIIPVLLGEPEAAVFTARQLRESGLLVGAIRPPTVPVGTSRLRITVSCAHTPADLSTLAAVVLRLIG